MTKNSLTKISAMMCCGAIALVLPVGKLHAAAYAETGDAGDLPTSAQLVGGQPVGTNLDHITGTITSSNGITEGDMFEIYINSPTTFSATTTNFAPGVNSFDTQLFLFNAAGLGVYANDDSPSGGSQSTLPSGSSMLSSLPAGVYYLLITGSGRYPIDSMGHLIFPNYTDGTTDPSGVYGPNSGTLAVAGYTGNSNEGGNYSIALTGAQFLPVPEPSVLGALALGGAGLILSWRRRRTGNRNS